MSQHKQDSYYRRVFFISLLAFAGISFVLFYLYLYPSWAFFDTDANSVLPEQSMIDLRENLEQHVYVLAEEIGERHFQDPTALIASIDYIRKRFADSGYNPGHHTFGGGPYHNIVAELHGHGNLHEVLVIGAHYDTVWHSPGADDNASGVAALLEIARLLSNESHQRTLRFITFANEEQPFAEGDEMGSQVYVRSLKETNDSVVAMFSLEMLGYYSDEKGSQRYPFPLNWIYPDRGFFIGFISNLKSTALLLRSLHHFRRAATFPVQGLAVPEKLVPDIRRSDHASFWDAGIPALMITDTANFRNRYYHSIGDTPETLDYDSMTRVVAGLVSMLRSLANPR
ncbi:MAG TPA: M20/M25/M40 family metallo-hydrolase [Gammaproteobacteria bacterium]|nr:M20/M25/M40 family metallo-hydrolase [Gammaproteobacteria bacterium]